MLYLNQSKFSQAQQRGEAMTDVDQADRFARAREAQSVALIEDYVEMIGDLIAELGEARVADIAERMGVAQPTATKAVARLKREGFATSRPYRGVFLTEEGAALAERVRARHRTVVALLVAVGVPEEVAELDAEGIEHHVSAQSLKAFEQFLQGK
ncbi:manganese-binding transcriptional regulator MntR [Celeribacter sp.]|uniref:manganese-binding transcriptional regulator MntR n=1 Tax=Celeribacter sp. TaxID=1890673 RepID=UPI003A92A47C